MDLKKRSSIQAPFLRLFLLYYGNLSLQLRPIRLFQWRSIVNLLWNFSFASVLYYVLFCHNSAVNTEVRRDERLERVFLEKPLFAIVFRIGLGFVFHLSFVLTLSYFIGINITNQSEHSLVALLDTFRVDRFDSAAKAKRIFAIALAGELLISSAAFLREILSGLDPRNESPWGILLQLVPAFGQAYILNLHMNMSFMLVLYYKYATLESLKQLNKSASIDIRAIERKLRELATLNRRLGHLLSLPLLISIFNYVLDYVITLSCVFIHPVNPVKCIYLLQFVLYPGTIAFINRRISLQLTRLATSLRDKSQYQEKIFKLAESLPIEPSASVQIRCREMFHIYERDFHIEIFNLVRFDFVYISNIAFFIVNLVVLIAQTTI